MKNLNLFKIFLIIFFIFTIFAKAYGNISSKIIVKVGSDIITNSDLENEINTFLILSNKQINQKNIDSIKQKAVKNLIQISIKNSEIKKYNIEQYSKQELDLYILNICKRLKTNRNGLKGIFSNNKIDYEVFIEKTKIELKWKSLIYSIYQNQININTVEVENDIKERLIKGQENMKYELSEIEISNNNENIGKYLEEVYNTIKLSGFKEAAKAHSISSSAMKGGKIGFFKEEILSKAYLQELKKIKTGGITKPIKNNETTIILKIDSIEMVKNQNLDFDEIKEEIIAKKKEEKLTLFSKSHFANLQNVTLIKFQ